MVSSMDGPHTQILMKKNLPKVPPKANPTGPRINPPIVQTIPVINPPFKDSFTVTFKPESSLKVEIIWQTSLVWNTIL